MYLSSDQVDQLLQDSFFANPVTQNVVQYAFYRGRMDTLVHTLRFNWLKTFDANFMREKILQYVLHYYPLNTQLAVSINYDLLLTDAQSQSFYIWRANSNAIHYSVDNDIYLKLTHDNIYRLVQRAFNVNIPSLDIHFRSSNVSIDRPLSIVISFFKL